AFTTRLTPQPVPAMPSFENKPGVGSPRCGRVRSARQGGAASVARDEQILPKRKSFAKRVRRGLAAAGVRLAALFLPRLYVAYMWLVEATSRRDDALLGELLFGCLERYDRAVAALWHQEVFSV